MKKITLEQKHIFGTKNMDVGGVVLFRVQVKWVK